MNLISCKFCGTVFDKDVLAFPPTHDHDSQEPIEENCEWNSDLMEYVAILPCPVCSGNIPEEED
jgi:hypothetical protein